jgi:hypothetical protein
LACGGKGSGDAPGGAAFSWTGSVASTPGSGGRSLRSTWAAETVGRSRSSIGARRGASFLQPRLDVTESLGDFLRLRLKIFGEHIEAPSDDTGDDP